MDVFTSKSARWLLRAILLSFLLLLAAVLALPYALPWLLQKQGIDFHWQNPHWHYKGFSASQVKLTLPSSEAKPQRLQLHNVRIKFAWHTFPIQSLTVSRVQAYWPITTHTANDDALNFTLPNSILKWLPQHIELPHIDANLPGVGRLQGSLNLQASAQGKLWQPSFIDSQLTLNNLQGAWLKNIPTELQPTQLSAQITTHPDHQDSPDGQQLLRFNMHSDGPARLQLNGLLHLQQTPEWQATLSHAQLFIALAALQHPALSAEALQAQIYFSGHADSQSFSLQLEEHSLLVAHNLQLADSASAQKISVQLAGINIQGHNAALNETAVHSPLNVHIEQLSAAQLHSQDWDLRGTLSGQLAQLELTSRLTGQYGLTLNNHIYLRDSTLEGNASLESVQFKAGNPLQKTFTDWPQTASINNGLLRGKVDFSLPSNPPYQLAINLHAQALDAKFNNSAMHNFNFDLNAQIDLQHAANWQGTLTDAQLHIQSDSLTAPDLHAEQLQAQAFFTGQADAQEFTLNFAQKSTVEAQQVKLSKIASAQKAVLQLANLKLQGSQYAPHQINIHSPLTVQLVNLSAEQLHSQDWGFTGILSGQLPYLELSGKLKGQQGLTLTSRIHLLKDSIKGNVTLQEIFFKAGNPLQKTFTAWPDLVTFDSGRLHSQIDFTLPYSGALQASAQGSVSGLDGIINRSELKNLGANFNGQLAGDTLTLSVPSLAIEQLDPGVPITQIQLHDAHYRSTLSAPLNGVANWKNIDAQVFNGRLWLDAQQLDLSRKQKLVLQLRGLELQELFRIYPTEGLAGSGIIDGQLPLFIDNGTIYIEAGQLHAREPGTLQFQSEKIEALGQTNPAMRIVADALDDFHFNLLSSGVSYDQSGKLLLNVRLEGQNPDVKKGRPIHLNINLEENIPALLASIQLSDQVSEIIQKRVRERLEQR